MRKNQQLVIVLPEGSEELPIRIVRGSRSMELRLCLCPPDGEERHINETCPERKYVFIIRIHRSRIVNLRHVETLVGNSLKIGNELLAIGRSCRGQCFTEVDTVNGILPTSAPVGQKRRKA